MPFTPTTQIALICVGLILLIWIAAGWIMARSGWKALADRYAAIDPPKGTRFPCESASIGRLGKYYRCLNIYVHKDGLHLSVNPLLRISHPPIFLRWSDIRFLRQQKSFCGPRFLYDLGFPRIRRIALREGIHQEIQYYQTGGT